MVAINEGRLRRLFRLSLEPRPELRTLIGEALAPWLDGALAAGLDDAMARERVLILNFRHRFHVRAVLPRLFAAWTLPSLWEQSPFCPRCPSKTACPILANASSLRDAPVQERLADVMSAVHFSGQRLPFRRLQALAALACTGGLRCAQVQDHLGAERAAPTDLLRHRFYDAIFPSVGGNSSVPIQREPLCQSISALDPGQATAPALDAAAGALVLESRDVGDLKLLETTLPPLEAAAVVHLAGQLRTSAESDADELAAEVARFTRSLRRLHAFSGASMGARSWRRALALLEDYANDDSRLELLRTVIGALNRLQRIEGRRDSLAQHQFDPGGFRNPERLALQIDLGTDFECRLVRGPELPPRSCRPWLESCPSDIRLKAWPRGAPDRVAELSLDANLVNAMLSIEEGYTQHGGLGAYRRDLARFFGQLVSRAKEVGRQPAISLRVDGQMLRVEAEATTGRLHFLRR